jgi:hypothetical protein
LDDAGSGSGPAHQPVASRIVCQLPESRLIHKARRKSLPAVVRRGRCYIGCNTMKHPPRFHSKP